MTLLAKQMEFSRRLVKLLQFGWDQGYEFTGGEWYRSEETAKIDAQEGKGIVKSNHCIRLAIDLCAFYKGAYLTESSQYAELGGFWKSLSTPDCKGCWGGDFSKPDGNHFSIENQGIQ